jgi:hypothetical protein
MSFMIECTHCQFRRRVQSETVAYLTCDRHVGENVCDGECVIDELGIEDRIRRADI